MDKPTKFQYSHTGKPLVFQTAPDSIITANQHLSHSNSFFPAMAMSVDAKLLKQTRFPPQFNQKVDMKKVNVEVMKKLVGTKILEKVH